MLVSEKSKKELEKSSLKDFLGILGVSDVPRLRLVYSGKIELNMRMNSEKMVLRFVKKNSNWLIIDFLAKQSCKIPSECFKINIYISKNQSIYRKVWRGYNYKPLNFHFNNFAHYQLTKTPWLKLENSPLRPSGRFAPFECFVSKALIQFFQLFR